MNIIYYIFWLNKLQISDQMFLVPSIEVELFHGVKKMKHFAHKDSKWDNFD